MGHTLSLGAEAPQVLDDNTPSGDVRNELASAPTETVSNRGTDVKRHLAVRDGTTGPRSANDLYRNTAGEIEARDAAARRSMTPEERKNTPPDLGGEETVFMEGRTDASQAIGQTTDGKPFAEITTDILAGVQQNDWISTVKRNLKKRFPNGITIGRNNIRIDEQSRKEMTYSRYAQWLRSNDPNMYEDKLRATDGVDDILYATTDWINEGLNHPRKDKIHDFARGNTLIRVGSNDYVAEVIVATEKNGTMKLYDIVNLQRTQFTKKEMTAAKSTNPSPGAARNTTVISSSTVAQNDGGVKRYSVSSEDSQGRMLTPEQQKFFAKSQARDATGRLLKLYHQTDGEFTIFDTRHPGAGSKDGGTPFGIFLKRSASDIGLAGKKQMELYANIMATDDRQHQFEK